MAERRGGVANNIDSDPRDQTRFGITVPSLPESRVPIQRPETGGMKRPEDYVSAALQGALTDRILRVLKGMAQDAGIETDSLTIALIKPPPEIKADFGFPCHKLAQLFKRSPGQIADKLTERLNQEVGQVEAPPVKTSSANGYMNLEVDADYLGNRILVEIEQAGERYGEQNLGNGEVVVLDCSSPNIAKEMSVAHLRSTAIGESLARIYRFAGWAVIRDNHLGDWGTQFGKLGRAVELWGAETPELRGDNPVQGLYKLYVRISKEIAREKDAGKESSLEEEGKEWFRRLEAGDPQARELLEWAIRESRREYEIVYSLLGVDFEYFLGESFYFPMLPQVIKAFLESEVARKDESGAVVVHFSKDNEDNVVVDLSKDNKDRKDNRLVIQKSDGASLYATRDLATLVARMHWFSPEKIIYVVGGEQSEYFKQLFATFKRFAKDECPELEHVAFGMVTLPEGKMSTREGRVVFLEEVLREAIERAKQLIKEKDKDKQAFSDEEIKTLARQIGVGAVIYLDLGQGRERNIQFDWAKALSIEGNSAPYIQYAHARAQSILRHAQESGIETDRTIDPHFELPLEQELARHLGEFARAIAKAIEASQPSIIAEYVYRVASLFNTFYNTVPIILQEKDGQKRNTRLRLVHSSAQVIRIGLNLLGIEAPGRM
ncbi:MAG: arginine--tRNA ligase [bacterium]|nr:arginine--tRNA ligase [bacterium]